MSRSDARLMAAQGPGGPVIQRLQAISWEPGLGSARGVKSSACAAARAEVRLRPGAEKTA